MTLFSLYFRSAFAVLGCLERFSSLSSLKFLLTTSSFLICFFAGKISWGFGNLLSKSSHAFAGGLHKLTTKDHIEDTHVENNDSNSNTEPMKAGDKTGRDNASSVARAGMSSADCALAVLVAAEKTVECQDEVSATVDPRGAATHADVSPARAEPSPPHGPTSSDADK